MYAPVINCLGLDGITVLLLFSDIRFQLVEDFQPTVHLYRLKHHPLSAEL